MATGVLDNLSFKAQGLPQGTLWFVTVAGDQGFAKVPSLISFQLPAGNYSFGVSPLPGYSPSPSTGVARVVNSTSTHLITFAPPPPTGFVVTFTESGLAAGTVWSASLNGATLFSSAGSIVFLEQNGTYGYGIGSVSQYTVSPQSGSVVVNGSAATVSITFTNDKGLLGLPGIAGYLLVVALALELLGALVLIGLWFRARRPRRPAPAEVKISPPPSA